MSNKCFKNKEIVFEYHANLLFLTISFFELLILHFTVITKQSLVTGHYSMSPQINDESSSQNTMSEWMIVLFYLSITLLIVFC